MSAGTLPESSAAPSVAKLGAVAQDLLARRIELGDMTYPKAGTEPVWDAIGSLVDAEDALQEMILSMQPRTLGDAAAQLSQAIEVLQYLEDFETGEDYRAERLAKVREVLANAVRLIGEAAAPP